ncbi:MAG: ROK family protein, partial [Lachnospiraceae bacterium]|nr:ROK family protein [Lachnospiraceae bacterium]
RIGFSYIMQDLRLLYSEETEAEVRVKAADYFFSREYRFMERGIRGIHLG